MELPMILAADPYANAAHPTADVVAEPEGSRIHPIIHAGKWIAADLFSTLLFVALYAVTHSVYAATGLSIAAGLGQIAYLKLRRSPIDAMQWMSLGLVVVFGGASLVTHDPRFVMLKPTLIYVVVGMVMLKPGWMVRYMPPMALQWSRDVVVAFGYVWAGIMFLTAALNLALVVNGDPKLWAWFIGVFPIASKLALFAVQYLTTRMIVVGRMRGNASALAA
jgi:intracellular septation protein A